ncbi:MAG: histidine phosphatase family protein [Rickettsia sp.]|jgi:broad specificity phosphatase PhoE|nr:histidine phosphatase family protein [Rickettsia sp.]
MTLPLKPFYFLRHGETDWNRQHVYMGSQDIPLNQTGENQAREASHILGKKDIKHIVTSPLIRAYRTAEIVNEKLKVDITIVLELAECY